jgi:hypothetical protein
LTDREKMLELLDELKNSIVKLMDEREKLDSEAEEFRNSRKLKQLGTRQKQIYL